MQEFLRIRPVSYTHLDVYKRQGNYIDEYAMLQQMQELIGQENIYMDSPPFFGVDEHACDPGYEPKENGSRQIREGSSCLLYTSRCV